MGFNSAFKGLNGRQSQHVPLPWLSVLCGYLISRWEQGNEIFRIPGRMNIHLLQRMSFLSRHSCLQWMAHFLASFRDSALPPGCSKIVTVLIGSKNLGNEASLLLGCDWSTGEYLQTFRTALVCRMPAVRTVNILGYKICP